jgi:hypothetical protein
LLRALAAAQKLGVELIDLVFNVEVNFGCGAVLGFGPFAEAGRGYLLRVLEELGLKIPAFE